MALRKGSNTISESYLKTSKSYLKYKIDRFLLSIFNTKDSNNNYHYYDTLIKVISYLIIILNCSFCKAGSV